MVSRIKHIVYPLFVYLFGCTNVDLDELREQEPVLTGILVEGETAGGFMFFQLKDYSGGVGQVPDNATISIHDENSNSCQMVLQQGSVFGCPGNDLVIAGGEQYLIEASAGDEQLSVLVDVPDPFDLLSLSNTTFTIDETQPTEIAFQFSWEDDSRYSYVLTLEPLNPDAIPSPFFPSDAFEIQYGLPVLEGQATFRADYFNYIGLFKVTIYAIDKAYESVFFFDPVSDVRGYLNAGPDNVEGGKGFITGVSRVEFEIEIIQ
jgi:hypothetical protein